MLSHVQLFCDLMDCNPPVSFVSGIFQARILEWGTISSSRDSSQPRDWTYISYDSYIGRWILYHWANWEAPVSFILTNYFKQVPCHWYKDFPSLTFFFFLLQVLQDYLLAISSLTLSQDKLTALIISAAQFWNLLNQMSMLIVTILLEKQSSWD